MTVLSLCESLLFCLRDQERGFSLYYKIVQLESQLDRGPLSGSFSISAKESRLIITEHVHMSFLPWMKNDFFDLFNEENEEIIQKTLLRTFYTINPTSPRLARILIQGNHDHGFLYRLIQSASMSIGVHFFPVLLHLHHVNVMSADGLVILSLRR